MLLPRLVDNIGSGKLVSLQGEIGIRINPIHVADAAKALVASLGVSGNQTFNIGGSEVLSLFEICETIAALLGVSVNYQRSEAKPSDLIGDVSAMKSELQSPQIAFRWGIKDLII